MKGVKHKYNKGASLYNVESIRPYLTNIEESKKIKPRSHRKINLKCPECDYTKTMSADKLIYRGFRCPYCDKSTSYPELFFMSYLKIKNINFEYQKIFSTLKHRKFDFYINNIGVIETHGAQHYEKNRESSRWDYKDTHNADKEKKQWCKENFINYIEIDCRESSFQYIKESINSCDFLPSITKEEENKILRQIEKNKRYPNRIIINDYKKGFNISELSKKYKVSTGTITRILTIHNIQLRENPTIYTPKKVRCTTTGDIFPSVAKAVEWADKSSKVAMACRGERKTAGVHPITGEKLRWEYVD